MQGVWDDGSIFEVMPSREIRPRAFAFRLQYSRLDWAATLSIVVAVSCGTGLEGGPPSPELIFDCALGPPAALFLCFLPVRPRPLAFLGIGTCHRAVCGDEQAGPGHGHRSTMWPCLWHITCVVVCRHTRQMVPPARILQHFSPHAPQSDCRFGEGPKSGPRLPPIFDAWSLASRKPYLD